MKELVEFLEKQIDVENKIVQEAVKSTSLVRNVLIRELIRSVAVDSHKHVMILNAVIGLISGPTPLIEEEDRDKIGKSIKQHIIMEAEAIKTYKMLADKHEGDEKLFLIFQYLLSDEKRHHALLTRIYKMIIDQETLTEDDMWDMAWRYSPFHGSPGG
ncbi:MAG: ferritin family protein [Candidatus Heimdallarchaeota archaeon]